MKYASEVGSPSLSYIPLGKFSGRYHVHLVVITVFIVYRFYVLVRFDRSVTSPSTSGSSAIKIQMGPETMVTVVTENGPSVRLAMGAITSLPCVWTRHVGRWLSWCKSLLIVHISLLRPRPISSHYQGHSLLALLRPLSITVHDYSHW